MPELLPLAQRTASTHLPVGLLDPSFAIVVPRCIAPAGGGLGWSSSDTLVAGKPPHRLIRHGHIYTANPVDLAVAPEGAQPFLAGLLGPIMCSPRARASEVLQPDARPLFGEERLFTAAYMRGVAADRRGDVAHPAVHRQGPEVLQFAVHVASRCELRRKSPLCLKMQESFLADHGAHQATPHIVLILGRF